MSVVEPRLWRELASLASERSASAHRPRSDDQESYPYRIGTVHMCRDAAYADAGVRSGAFKRLFVLNFSGVALDM